MSGLLAIPALCFLRRRPPVLLRCPRFRVCGAPAPASVLSLLAASSTHTPALHTPAVPLAPPAALPAATALPITGTSHKLLLTVITSFELPLHPPLPPPALPLLLAASAPVPAPPVAAVESAPPLRPPLL